MRNLLVKKQIYIDMKPLSQKLRKTGLSLLWGTTVWLFWRIVYPGHLQYHEQYQLFLFDMEYWKYSGNIKNRAQNTLIIN